MDKEQMDKDKILQEMFGRTDKDSAQKGRLVLEEGDTGIFLQKKDIKDSDDAGICIAFRVEKPKEMIMLMGALISKAAESVGMPDTKFCAMALSEFNSTMALTKLRSSSKEEFVEFMLKQLFGGRN